jgi:NDP-sugar pyrophosphorylase family protein
MRAVILAGGKGTRLAPYTTVFPKPLMPIGEMPILEVVVRQLKAAGIVHITMAVGHLAELLRAFFNNGKRFGLQIDYSLEEKALGTAGPLTLIPGLNETFLMMNGDILCDIDYRNLIEHHKQSGATATIATFLREVHIDFGVIEADENNRLTEYVEKPTLNYRVSMGIYVFEPRVLHYLTPGKKYDFPDLVKTMSANGEQIESYPFNGYWLDIGRPDDYARAVEEFEERRRDFLPAGESL